MVWVCIFEYAQHDTIDNLNKVLRLKIYAPLPERLSNHSLILILIDQLPEHKLRCHGQHLPNIPNHMPVFQRLLQQIQLIDNLLGRVVVPPLQHHNIGLQNGSQYDFGVVLQFRSDFVGGLHE